MKVYPEPIVGAFILNKNNQILLVQSHKWQHGIWHVPRGHIEMGESIEKATIREVKEEVGLDVEFVEVFAVFEAIYPADFARKKHFIFLECKCIAKNDQVNIDNDEISRAEWFDIKEIKKINLENFTNKAIKKLLNSSNSYNS